MKSRGIHRAENFPTSRSFNRFHCLDDESHTSEEDTDGEDFEGKEIIKKQISRNRRGKTTKVKTRSRKEQMKNGEYSDFDKELLAYDHNDDSKTWEDLNRRFDKLLDIPNKSKASSDSEINENIVNCHKLLPVPLMNIDIKIQSLNTKALIDTGATTNMISKSVFEKLNCTIDNNSRKIKGLGDAEIVTLGIINIPFSFYNICIGSTPFHVVDNDVLQIPVILGKKFCEKSKLIIDMHNRRLVKYFEDGSKVDIYLEPEDTKVTTIIHESVKVFAANTVIIDNEINQVEISFEETNNGLVHNEKRKMYFEGNLNNENFESLDGILDVQSKNKSILVQPNLRDIRTYKIKKGDYLGTVSSIVEIEQEQEEDESDWSLTRLQDEVDIGKNLNAEQRNKVVKLLMKMKNVLSKTENDIGNAQVTPQRIILTNQTPIWQKPRRFADPLTEEIERQCKELELNEIIEKCNSPWSSPVVPIRKTDGTLRLCIDYRRVNSVTKQEKFPMPNLSDSIYSVHNVNFFSKIDLTKGYYQVPIHEDSRAITSFSTQHNQYQFKRLSFGLRNSGIQFQRTLQEILSKFSSKQVIIYIDDIMIVSKNFEEHLELIEKVLNTLQQNGIKIKVNKCEFLKEEVSFLGHTISRQGIRKCVKYVEKVQNYPKPENINQLRRFLGLANFQRKFVRNFSAIAKPLSSCTNGPKRKKLIWTEDMNKAYEEIKKRLVEESSLAFPDYSKESNPLELFVDASGVGAGACLMQKQKDEYRTIAYSSIAFNSAEQNYSPGDRELLALRWGVKSFRQFLFGAKFVIHTDHKPLMYLKNMSRDNARLSRIVSELEEYDYEIRYRPGPQNESADALSRIINIERSEEQYEDDARLPNGLKVSEKIDGGGDSMFEALFVVLENANLFNGKFENVTNSHELRLQLVNHLTANLSKLKIKYDKNRLKEIRAIRHKGVLPCNEILIAVCDLYSVELQVHHGMESPILYKTDKVNNQPIIIHLQCLAGIHFNPVVNRRNVSIPVKKKLVNIINIQSEQQTNMEHNSFMNEINVLVQNHAENFACRHDKDDACTFAACVGNISFCTLVDTGAQVSLITEEVWKKLKLDDPSLVLETTSESCFEKLVGVGNQRVNILGIINLKLRMLEISMDETMPFAVIQTEFMPNCCILGANFLSRNHIIMDFDESLLYYENSEGDELYYPIGKKSNYNQKDFLGSIETEKNNNLGLMENDFESDDDEVNFKVKYIISEDLVNIQKNDYAINDLKDKVENDVNTKLWKEGYLKQYKRYSSELIMKGEAIFRKQAKHCSALLPFALIADIAYKTHTNLGHIGSNKLQNTVLELFWHPALEKICRDICTSCLHCQLYKVHRQHIQPPIIKLQTMYPYQLLSMDIMLLPKSSKGNIAVLVAIDSYSKWITAIPIKNKTTSTVTNALKYEILPNLPMVPSKILTDNGPEFRSHEFNDALKQYNIRHILSTPYKPSSNGLVERSNRTIIQLLKGVLREDCSKWDILLHKALIIYNNTIHSQTKSSPSNMILNKAHENNRNIPINSDMFGTWKAGNPKFSPFQIGQKVLYKTNRTGNNVFDKLKPRYEGPYQIVKVQPNKISYRMERFGETPRVVDRAHYTQLKVFNEVPTYLKDLVDVNEDCSMKGKSKEKGSISSGDNDFVGFISDEENTLDESSSKSTDAENMDDKEGSKNRDEDSTSDKFEKSDSVDEEITESRRAVVVEEIESKSIQVSENSEQNNEKNNVPNDENVSDTTDEPCESSTNRKIMTKDKVSRKVVMGKSCDTKVKLTDSECLLKTTSHLEIKSGRHLVDKDVVPLEMLHCSEVVMVDPVDKLTSTPFNGSINWNDFQALSEVMKHNVVESNFDNDNNRFVKSNNDDLGEVSVKESDLKELLDFIEDNENAWNHHSKQLSQEMEVVEEVDNEEEEIFSNAAGTPIDEAENISKSFDGFELFYTGKMISSDKIKVLRELQKNSLEHRDRAKKLRNSHNFWRRFKEDDLMGSEGRMKYKAVLPLEVKEDEVVTRLDFDSETPRRVTRSSGKPLNLPNVQVDTIEYRK